MLVLLQRRCLSVCLSECLSVTLWYRIKTNKASMNEDYRFFYTYHLRPEIRKSHPERGRYMKLGYVRIGDSRRLSHRISKQWTMRTNVASCWLLIALSIGTKITVFVWPWIAANVVIYCTVFSLTIWRHCSAFITREPDEFSQWLISHDNCTMNIVLILFFLFFLTLSIIIFRASVLSSRGYKILINKVLLYHTPFYH